MTVQCDEGGYVVGQRHPVPTEPRVRYVKGGPWIGCNQILCGDCGARVKWIDDYAISTPRPPTTDEISRVYDDPVVAKWPAYFLPGHGVSRAYLCRCSWMSIGTVKRLQHLDTYNIDDWACSGHPAD